jgi:hypothetical protein
MARRSTAAPQGATGTCRDSRRAARGGRAEWIRPYRRMRRALRSSLELIQSSLRMAADSERCMKRYPVRSWRQIDRASARLQTASARIGRATRGMAQVHECLLRDPAGGAGAPGRMTEAMRELLHVSAWLTGAFDQVFGVYEDVAHGLETGELVPEPPAERHRRRIIVAPRPTPLRAFLRARQPRVTDRISPLLRRRRRARRPAALSVPPRTAQGRAPPLSSICLL